MRELKELLCKGERVYELTRCASSPVYFIGPETDDIDHMDVSGALEDTLHRMVDAEFTEEEIAEHLCAYQDSDAMDDDDCYYIDLDYVIYDFYPMSIIDTGIHYEEPQHTYTVHFFDTVICKNLVIKDDATDDEILEAMQEKLGINPEEFIVNDVRGDGTLIGIQNLLDESVLLVIQRKDMLTEQMKKHIAA